MSRQTLTLVESRHDAVLSLTARSVFLCLPSAASLSFPFTGWGYRDTEFRVMPSGDIGLAGHRYSLSGQTMPQLRSWMEARTGIDVKDLTLSQPEPTLCERVVNAAFMREVERDCHHVDVSDRDRLFHAHGHTAQEIFTLRFSSFARVPDCVVYPASQAQVQTIVRLAAQHDVCIIPFGGGTTVSQSLLCPASERRMIVSLDLRLLSAITDVNRHNMTATIGAGAIGRQIEQQLNAQQLTLGHEPDSMEFSSLGGWIATRASGMRRSRYGNIEDIVLRITMVLSDGSLLHKSTASPRMSTGPDLHHIALGSEGTLGVITQAVVKVFARPECSVYGSVVFPSFTAGVEALREIQRQRLCPTSIRLVDNAQFQFGQALKADTGGEWTGEVVERVKRWYVTKHKKFDVNVMVAATLLFEGRKAEVAAQEAKVYAACAQYGGLRAGAENGVRGYFLTYMIAYLRDFGFQYSFIAESFETSCQWDAVNALCEGTKQLIVDSARRLGVSKRPFVSCRVTQSYDSGVCVYFYFGFVWKGLKDPVAVFSQIEHEAREAVLRYGGSLSHHHGVGKLRKDWVERQIGSSGVELLRMMKRGLDPKNVFGSGNLID